MAHIGIRKSDHLSMWRLFKGIDRDQSGEIDIQEFFQWLGQPKTSFTLGLFELIDTDNTQSLDFHEFVHALVTFACFDKTDMTKFCFFVFDNDKNGYIEEDELDYLLECLHSTTGGLGIQSVDELMQQLDVDSDGRITFTEFERLCRLHDNILFPAWAFQAAIRQKSFTADWWDRQLTKLLYRKGLKGRKAKRKRRLLMNSLRAQQRHQLRREAGARQYMAHKISGLFLPKDGRFEDRVKKHDNCGMHSVTSDFARENLKAFRRWGEKSKPTKATGSSGGAPSEKKRKRKKRSAKIAASGGAADAAQAQPVDGQNLAASEGEAGNIATTSQTADEGDGTEALPTAKSSHGRRWSQEVVEG
eukprot:g754.t1